MNHDGALRFERPTAGLPPAQHADGRHAGHGEPKLNAVFENKQFSRAGQIRKRHDRRVHGLDGGGQPGDCDLRRPLCGAASTKRADCNHDWNSDGRRLRDFDRDGLVVELHRARVELPTDLRLRRRDVTPEGERCREHGGSE